MTAIAKDNRATSPATPAPAGKTAALGGAGKAAVLVLAMGKPLAGRMLKHLDTAEVRALMRRASELGPVAADAGALAIGALQPSVWGLPTKWLRTR